MCLHDWLPFTVPHTQPVYWTLNEKALREMQTLRAGCSKAQPKIFTPPQNPFPGARDSQNLISWRRSLPLPTDPVWWGSIHAVSSYHGNRPTNTCCPPTQPASHKQTGPITIHCATASVQCKDQQCSMYTINPQTELPFPSLPRLLSVQMTYGTFELWSYACTVLYKSDYYHCGYLNPGLQLGPGSHQNMVTGAK